MNELNLFPMKNLRIIGCIACLSFFACQPQIQETVEPLALTESADDLEMRSRCPDGKVEWIFLQVNDVYEIAPLEGGKKGGMARIATLKKRLLCENPNTYAFMAGDFVNPSVIGTLKYNGENIRGKQMIEVMNAAGIDYACFGNHEFDLNEADLQKRIDESQFEWIASNAFHVVGGQPQPFTQTRNGSVKNLPEYKILEIKEKGTKEQAKVGLWSVLLPSNKPNYVTYTDFMTTSKTLIDNVLRPKSDAVVGLTHLFLEDDLKLAAQNPTLSLLMGGHDHENSTNWILLGQNCGVF
jgi:2',3'-cyclic-nucleotide 2'-phosphodiesterase (5'-nucleotidase family)